MPSKCDFCSEVKPCRKKRYWGGLGGAHINFNYLLGIINTYDFVCKECDTAHKILALAYRKEREIKEDKEIKDWIKKRDKILSKQKWQDVRLEHE